MSRQAVSTFLKEQVRRRAKQLCEYCHASEEWQYVQFTVDHVIPVSSGGTNALDNLALSCFHCNRQKWNHTKGVDPETKLEAELFNPRIEPWSEHFVWDESGLNIVGLTSTGRATVNILRFNRERIVSIRSADKEIGRHPPEDDLIQRVQVK